MRIISDENVLVAAKKRINFLFDEFDNIIVCVSGGKDSDVIFNLTLDIAKERGRLPLKTMFLDQEIEWQMTIDHIERIMYKPEVEPMWFQMEFDLFNATSFKEHWLHCWDNKKTDLWIREKDPISLKDNIFNEVRFAHLFRKIPMVIYPKQKTAFISGVRTEESPGRFMGLTQNLTYKYITWGSILSKDIHFTFYPIYDWTYIDVWKYINDNNIPYNKIYDYYYRYGVKVRNMRVSNLHHETAVRSLFYLQELEPVTYERVVKRLDGVDMAGKMNKENFFIQKLPFMFKDWREYRDYLLDKLIDEKWKDKFARKFAKHDRIYGAQLGDEMWKVHIDSILTNDWEFVKLNNWETRGKALDIKDKNKGKPITKNIKNI